MKRRSVRTMRSRQAFSRGSLHEQTLELLHASPKPLIQLYDETRIPIGWLSTFKRGSVKDPSVNRVQRLYEHLSGRSLSL